MKKLIIAAAVFGIAAVTQASTVIWGLSGNLDTTTYASGTAYLICVDNLAKPSLTAETAADWYSANGSKLSSVALTSAAVADGAISSTDSINEAIGRKNYWLIIDNGLEGEDHYIAVSTTTKALNITTSTMNVSAAWTASSQMASFAASSVPEPTSGLLMLLGIAGLALRRKRA